MMGAPKLRLAVAAILFVAWLGWLGYLAFSTREPVVLSRPQFLVADLWVIGRIESGHDGKPSSEVEVAEVLWSARGAKPQGKIVVLDLPRQRPGPGWGWAGPREYILPLTEDKGGKVISYRVTRLPPSPGFRSDLDDIRIYPASGEARAQLHELRPE